MRAGIDPDDQLRMVQLRDFLQGQSWFDSTQYRMNAPQGAPMHWSRLIELPLALIIVLLSPIFGQPIAEMIAGTAIPLMTLGLATYCIAKVTMRLHSREACVASVILVFCSIAILMQFRPMRIDHHGWQIVMACLSYYTLMWDHKKRAGLVLGMAMAIWTHISLEGLPVTAAFFVILGWRWVFGKAHGERLLWAIASFTTGTFGLFFATQPNGFNALSYCDTISPPQLMSVFLAALIMLPAIAYAPQNWRIRLIAAIFAGGLAIGSLLLTAPQCAQGAFGTLDPIVRTYWYEHISEGLPIWRQDTEIFLILCTGPICSILALITLWRRGAISQTPEMNAAIFLMLYSFAISVFVFRTISVATFYAVPILSIMIATLFKVYRQSEIPKLRVSAFAAMMFLALPGIFSSQIYVLVENYTKGSGGKIAIAEENKAYAKSELCESAKSIAALSKLRIGRIDASFDLGPMILLTTPHSVLASSHHRNQLAMRDHIQIFRLPPAQSKIIALKRGINYIVACPNEAELSDYTHSDPKGLWPTLAKGQTPDWLVRLPDMGGGIQVWRVKTDLAANPKGA